MNECLKIDKKPAISFPTYRVSVCVVYAARGVLGQKGRFYCIKIINGWWLFVCPCFDVEFLPFVNHRQESVLKFLIKKKQK